MMATRLSSQHGLGVLLGALCLGLAVLAATELGAATAPEQNQAPSVPATAKPSAASAVASFTLPPVQRFSVVTERPLFAPDRKPPQHDETAGAWSAFVLAGIIISPQSREALVLHGKPQTIAHVQEGQALEGWTVTSIYPDRVVFGDGLNEHELRLVPKAGPPVVQTRPRLPIE